MSMLLFAVTSPDNDNVPRQKVLLEIQNGWLPQYCILCVYIDIANFDHAHNGLGHDIATGDYIIHKL